MTDRGERVVGDASLREFLESVPHLVWSCAADGACDYVGPQWLAYTGQSAASQLGYGWLEQVHPDDRTSFTLAWEDAVNRGVPFGSQCRLRRFDGAYRWFDSRAMPVRDERGAVTRWFGTSTDVDEQHIALDAHERVEDRLQTVLENLTEGLVMCSVDGEVLYWNRAGLDIHDFATLDEGLRALPQFADTFELRTLDGRILEYDDWPLPRVLRGERVSDMEVRLRRLDRDWERVITYNGAMLQAVGGEALGFLSVTDRTDAHTALEALRAGEERLRLATEAGGIGTYDVDHVRQEVSYSPEMCDLLGIERGTRLGTTGRMSFVHPDDLSDFETVFAAALDPDGPGTAKGETRIMRGEREVRWASWSAQTVFCTEADGTRRPIRTVGAFVDVTDARRAERRLATQVAVSRVLANAVSPSDAVPPLLEAICETEGWDYGSYWEVDPNLDRLVCASVWHGDEPRLEIFARQTHDLQFEHGEWLPGAVWALNRPELVEDAAADERYKRAPDANAAQLHGTVAFPVSVADRVFGVLDFARRGTGSALEQPLEMYAQIGRQLGYWFERMEVERERATLEAQLRQAQRLEALGALSGGIAHDFNNILAAIVGNADLALLDMDRNDPAVESLEAISRAARRARELVQRVLTFAQQRSVERVPVSLAAVVHESVRLLRATMPAGVDLRAEVEPGLPDVLGDSTQLQQVIVNLGTNSWHALDGRYGNIRVSLSSAAPGEAVRGTLVGPAANT
jgi:PAS domain S-box-containing protein